MLNNGKMLESTHRRSNSGLSGVGGVAGGGGGGGGGRGGGGEEGEEGDVLVIVVPDITPVAFRLMLDFIYLDAGAVGLQMTEKMSGRPPCTTPRCCMPPSSTTCLACRGQ